jgi:CheY-like chemotaxis protein
MFSDGAGAPIGLTVSRSELPVHADAARLHQIVWNLLSNARKFTPADGSISVRVEQVDATACVTVADNGAGISAEDIPRLFTAFTQLEDEKSRPEGLGLGLAISRSIAEAHGGELDCRSDGLGRGSQFQLRIPLMMNSAPASVAESPDEPSVLTVPARASVLLVEDHHATAQVLARLITSAGYQVQTAHSLEAAHRLLERWKPDLLLSDLGLPDGSGYDLMNELRQSGVIGISVSGFGTAEDIRQSKEAGFSAHLIKPVTIEQLLHTISRTLIERSECQERKPAAR